VQFSPPRQRKIAPDPFFRLEHIGAVHLTHLRESRVIDVQGAGEIFPTTLFFIANTLQRKVARAEAMRRNRGKRCATQSGSP
jgi:hypothetical protein